MGKRSTSKHAASAGGGAALRHLLVAVICGGLVFVLSGLLLGSATAATRLLMALGTVVAVYSGLLLAKIRRAQGGRRRAVVVPAEAPEELEELEEPEASTVDGPLAIFEPVDDLEELEDDETPEADEAPELVEDTADEAPELVEDTADEAPEPVEDTADEAPEPVEDTDDEPTEPAADAEEPAVPALLLEQLMQQAMAEELANAAAAEDAEDAADAEPVELVEAHAPDAGVLVPDEVTHDLVPISSLHQARAEAEAQSLQRIRATVRGLGVRTGDDPVAVDVLARVVAAVDRLMVSDSSFERPALSETGPLLAAAAGSPEQVGPPAQEAMPMPAVPAMRPSDMPVTELSGPTTPAGTTPDEAPAPAPALTADTRPMDVVVEDPELVLPIPAPPKPQPAPRGRRLRRNSVA